MTTSKAPISLRPTAPTLEDGRAFARLLDEAQEGYFRAMLGRRAGDIIAQAFTQPGHDLSHQYVTFAELSGRIVGMASGYTADAHRHFTDEPLQAAAGRRRFRLAAFTRITRCVVRFIDTVPDGSLLCESPGGRPRSTGSPASARFSFVRSKRPHGRPGRRAWHSTSPLRTATPEDSMNAWG